MPIPRRPPLQPKHTEERLKLAANGLQALALLLFGAVLLSPLLNASVVAPLWVRGAAFMFSGACELSAFILLRYIPTDGRKDNVP